ncbi:MAG TPA: membrane dipeptidase [Polyangiaceae bacterium]|jgi:membrane dipeptidase|nr:membrane dipeptidase [Polyangiaceae bacterium]
MSPLFDPRDDPAAWARKLSVSQEAVELYLQSDVIDLHIDAFIWQRLFGRSLLDRQRGLPFLPGVALGHADLPRVCEARITGATWVVTTNPFREPSDRVRAFLDNVERLRESLANAPELATLVTTAAEYRAARAAGRHAAFIGVQGGSAFDADLSVLDRLPRGLLLRVTVMHLTHSELGVPSAPLTRFNDEGLGARGIELVHRLDEQRIFVDLAHASPKTFWDAARAHDPSLPLVVTHTGVAGVYRHWRNIDDSQLRAVAETGGVVGIIYHSPYLGDPVWRGRVETVVRHLEHVRDVLGDDFPALGSDWDGFIVTPRDMPTCSELPRLVECMLQRGWRTEAVQKALGANFLRALAALRG